ncbi:replication initiator protein A [Bacillus paralicheniformis]|uniref:replication initiator protein A n=1 Tax=Bacillus paralicheniformis TaxID=1648923 RepID=UPI001FD66605|nr:replication initiator protein A [Bacillus paralicheniformis]MCJ8223724.1 replication initiator protein A [Bacillus paralicheniformis]
MENNSKYFNIYEEYGLKYVQLPKVFLTSEKYRKLSSNAKIAWAVLRDRFSLSKKNGWIEKETGRIYFNFDNKTLGEVLNVKSETTIIKIKKELINAELLEQKRMGLNVSNRLYLLKPEVTQEDIYEIDKLEEAPKQIEPSNPNPHAKTNYLNGTTENEVPPETLKNQGTTENEVPLETPKNQGTTENEVLELQNMKTINTESSDSIISDTLKDTYKETAITELSEKEYSIISNKEKTALQDQILKDSLKSDIPEMLHHTLTVFSENYDEMYKWVGIIFRAKKKVEDEEDILLMLEKKEIETAINQAFVKGIRIIRNSQDIESHDNYLFITLYNQISNLAKEIKRASQKRVNGYQLGDDLFS